MHSAQEMLLQINPFQDASPEELVPMGEPALPKAQAEHEYWSQRTFFAWRALVYALCWARDNEFLPLSVEVFKNHTALTQYECLYEKGLAIAHVNGGVWDKSFVPLQKYMLSLNGFADYLKTKNSAKPVDLPASTRQAHGERTMQLDYVLRRLGGMPAYL